MSDFPQTIHVVDDDEAMRDSMAWLLEGEGYAVACYDSADSFLVTGHGDVPMAVSALQRGACDFIEKPFSNEDLLSRIRRALALDSQISARRQRDSVIEHRLRLLTQREREVMQLVVAGKLNKQVADELDISMKTVEAHRARVMEKMGVRTVAELVKAVMSVN